MQRFLLLALVCAALPLALGAQWRVLPGVQMNVLFGVTFQDADNGFVAGGDDGVGAAVLHTTDGESFRPVPVSPVMMLMSAASSPKGAVATGVGMGGAGTLYWDGARFTNASMGDISMQATQSAAVIGAGEGFAVVGEFGFWDEDVQPHVDGVAFSEDQGRSFQYSPVPSESFTRYGSFPSRRVGFVTAGSWPRASLLKKGGHAISQHLQLQQTKRGVPQLQLAKAEKPAVQDDANAGWMGEVFKSVDGYQTWERVFVNHTYYLNQIDCPTERVCFAVGESNDDAYAIRSMDGGATWRQMLEVRDMSLIAVVALSEQEVWLGGGALSRAGFNGALWHSVDGGETFERSVVPGTYFTDLAFVNSTLGYATAINEQSKCNVLKYE